MAITVSKLSPQDRTDWERLYHGYADFYQVPMNQEILDTVWSWIFDEQNKFYCIAAKNDEGSLLGFMHYREMPSPLRGKSVGFLDDLYVLPESRGAGVVDALFDSLRESSRNNGWPIVRWITADNNYRGRGVYDKLAERTQWITYQLPIE